MDLLDKVLLEWSARTDKGYPDLNNEQDLAIFESMFGFKLNEQEEEDSIESEISKQSIIDYIKSADLDPKQIKKLYQRVSNFGNYRAISGTMKNKGYGEKIYKKYSKQIQDIIEDLPPSDSKTFAEFLSNKKQPDFPTNSRKGNIITDLANTTNLSKNIINAIFKHTAQDAKKRGVGMGEIALSLLFKNITNTTSKKGDLAIDGSEFEIKGTPSPLGGIPAANFSRIQQVLSQFDVEITPGRSGGIKYKDFPKRKLNELAGIFADLYKNEDKNRVKEVIKNLLEEENVFEESRFNKINFSDPHSININVGLMNFIRYATAQGFEHFLVHDYGEAKSATNTGKYIYVSGDPRNMAEDLFRLGVDFQGITPNLFKTRISTDSKSLEEYNVSN